MSATVDLSCPIETSHPDNTGLVLALLGLPGVAGGSRWPDATGRTNGGTLQGGIVWSGSGLAFPVVGSFADTASIGTINTPMFFACTVVSGTANNFGGIVGYSVPLSLNTSGTGSANLTASAWFNSTFRGVTLSGFANNQPQRIVIGWTGQDFAVFGRGTLRGSFAHNTAPNYYGTQSNGVARFSSGSASNRFEDGVIQSFSAYRFTSDLSLNLLSEWVARDYEWSLNPARDPRLRRLSGTAYFTPISGNVGPVNIPRFILQTRRRLTGVS